MKLFKMIILIFLNILSIPMGIIAATGAIWYILPQVQTTNLGLKLLSVLSPTTFFWIVLSCGIGYIITLILQKIFNKESKAKLKNLFIHLNTWLIALTTISLSIATFVLVNPLIAEEVIISIPRKIGIGVGIILLMLFHIFSGKLSIIINRRIQAYETAKEMNAVGRGSVIGTNILKLFELFFPEFMMLGIICFCISWNVASYFLVILVAFIIPLIGNIECDFNIRAEVRKNTEKEKNILAEKVANNLRESR